MKVRGFEGWNRSLFLAVLAALALRLLVASICYTDITKSRRDHWSFGYETGRIARSIATGQGFASPLYHESGPTAWMTPAYPYILAGVFAVFGVYTTSSALAILGLQSLLSALTCIPIFFIARRWFGKRTAEWSAWMWALFPYAIYLSADFVWENCLTTLLLTTLVWMTLNLDRQRTPWAWAGYGLLWGLTALVNPVVLTVLPVAAAWALWRLHRRGARWRAPAILMLATFIATLAPWEIRNQQTFGQWVPLRDNFWLEVWVGNNGNTTLRWVDDKHPSNSPKELRQYEELGEIRYMDRKRQEALAFVGTHPGLFLRLLGRRVVYTWTGYWSFAADSLAEEPFDTANLFFAIPLTLLMAAGLAYARRWRRKGAGLGVAMLVLFPLVYYLTHPDIRYRHPIDPEILMLAVYGAICLLGRVRAPQAVPKLWELRTEIRPAAPAQRAEGTAGSGRATRQGLLLAGWGAVAEERDEQPKPGRGPSRGLPQAGEASAGRRGTLAVTVGPTRGGGADRWKPGR